MATEEDNKKELLQICLTELKDVYHHVISSLNNVRTKSLALLAAEVAVCAFLFSPSSKFFYDNTPIYGFALFGLGILLLVVSFAIFITSISSVNLNHPPDEKDIKNLYKRFNNSSLEFLEYLKQEYMSALPAMINTLDKRSSIFMKGVYAFFTGTVLIILIKYCSSLISTGGH